LRHDLSKRGHYYRIYSDHSADALDTICTHGVATGRRGDADDLADTSEAVTRSVINQIRRRWPAKAFERFSGWLFDRVPGVEVSKTQDSGKGWDLLIRVRDPLSGDILFDEVPVQCKNFTGLVTDPGPIEDLVRAVRNADSPLAYLAILGKIDDEYRRRIAVAEEQLTTEMGKPVRFFVLDEATLAQMYLAAVSTVSEEMLEA
jgi:hypothetical protein